MRKCFVWFLILALWTMPWAVQAEQDSPLVVRGYGFDPYMIPAFMSDHPEIPLVIDNDFSVSRTQFISAIQSRDSSTDIYVLPDSWNVWSLIDKGYARDLSPYPALRESVGTMVPQLQQAVTHGDQIFALPIALYASAWSVRPDLLKAAGYDHIPETMTEFLQMQLDWDWDKAGEYDFTFASTAYDGYDLRLYPYLEMVVSEYITQYECSDQPLSFDTPAFRQVLAALEALGYPSENVDEVLAGPADDALLSGRPADASGTCVTCVMEGARPVLAEVQALLAPCAGARPMRSSNGFDYNRASMLLAVLEKRGSLKVSQCDAYLNIIGGLTLDEPAADLAAVVAIASSYLDKPVPGTMAAVGEVGLSGEIRSITHMEQRLSEVKRLGFTQCMVPAHKIKDLKSPAGLELLPVANISGALRLLAQGK